MCSREEDEWLVEVEGDRREQRYREIRREKSIFVTSIVVVSSFPSRLLVFLCSRSKTDVALGKISGRWGGNGGHITSTIGRVVLIGRSAKVNDFESVPISHLTF
jgi:hypothetical protein